MEIWFNVRTYDRSGGHRPLSLIGAWLEANERAANVGLTELEVEVNIPHSGPPRKTLEEQFDRFHTGLSSLPTVVFSPKKASLRLRYRSALGDAKTLLASPELSVDLFRSGFDEFAAVIEALAPSLRKKKGLDYTALREWVLEARATMPATDVDLGLFEERHRAEQQQRAAARSPWERLDIDWEKYHPEARRILDDPFFWDGTDDYAPHGNDTGADLLDALRHDRAAARAPREFLDRLFASWGMKADVLSKRYSDFTEADEISLVTWAEAAVALAFGLVKLHGVAPVEAVDLALEAMRREREFWPARGFPSPDERLAAMSKVERKLLELRGACCATQ